MRDIYKRIAKLEKLADHSGFLTVVYTDGTKRKRDGGSCIELVLGNSDNIASFEGGPGVLAGLLNELLKS